MNNIAIQCESLGKRYRLGQTVGGHRTLREAVSDGVSACWSRLRSRAPARGGDRDLWALRDVTFALERGRVLGVIGRNGAGKSTLLKILSRITDPTEGRVTLRGRVASLLEVGTGFHPELTGRENIFLNGAILGMTRREIRRKMDAIVSFSGVERFLDTPVKRYSSGMAVRLAFSVAAHLEPEILIVDEVLAVGDAEFQERCLGRMRQLAGGGGRTVLFVSHNMAAVQSLCDRAVLLEGGRLTADGPPAEVIDRYLGRGNDRGGSTYHCASAANDRAWIRSARLVGRDGRLIDGALMSEPMTIEIELAIGEPSRLTLSLQISERDHSPVYHFHTTDSRFAVPSQPGAHRVRAELPGLMLYPGEYELLVTLCEAAGSRYTQLHQSDALRFTVRQDASVTTRALDRRAGLVFSRCGWSAAATEPAHAAAA